LNRGLLMHGWYYIRKINSRKRQKRGPSIYDPRQPLKVGH